jgi:hypothetical protein
MKKMITLVFFFVVMLCKEGTAQEPGDSKPLASTHTMKARRELKHEKQVHKRDRKLVAKNERHARHFQKDTYSLKFTGRKKRPKEKKHKEKKGTATIGESQAKK